MDIMRIEKITLRNFKNVRYGSFTMPSFLKKDVKCADILGIYGSSGHKEIGPGCIEGQGGQRFVDSSEAVGERTVTDTGEVATLLPLTPARRRTGCGRQVTEEVTAHGHEHSPAWPQLHQVLE